VSVIDSVSPALRVGIQLHTYQLGDLGGSNIQVDWASGDYRLNDYLDFAAARSKLRPREVSTYRALPPPQNMRSLKEGSFTSRVNTDERLSW